ncbi:hypothetical protein F4778DRAFT_781720 [Xylariomycetidae sp. FL2044]|nr:hypothetical protein F4778DRAFT_781720 [Xylariomycetidae sp. FL2044]
MSFAASSPPSISPSLERQLSQLIIEEDTLPPPSSQATTTQSYQPSSTISSTTAPTQTTPTQRATSPRSMSSFSSSKYTTSPETTFSNSSPLSFRTTGSNRRASGRSPRLFRTRSGGLASAAELRRRRELERHEDELMEMILEGIVEEMHDEDEDEGEVVTGGLGLPEPPAASPTGSKQAGKMKRKQKLAVTMAMDESGRWRIVRRDEWIRLNEIE